MSASRQAVIPVTGVSLATTLAVSLLLVLAGFAVYTFQSWGGDTDYAHSRRGNHGLDAACEFGDAFTAKPECRTSSQPYILIWGDSYAIHLMGAIAATTELGLVQATKTTCGPLLSVSVFRSTDSYNRHWAFGRVRFNRSVIDYLARADSVEVVVLSSQLEQYLAGNRLLVETDAPAPRALPHHKSRWRVRKTSQRHMGLTVAAIRALGKRVVLVAPTPISNFDVGRCVERNASGKIMFGADMATCEISEARYRTRRASVGALLRRVARDADVPVLDMIGLSVGTENARWN